MERSSVASSTLCVARRASNRTSGQRSSASSLVGTTVDILRNNTPMPPTSEPTLRFEAPLGASAQDAVRRDLEEE